MKNKIFLIILIVCILICIVLFLFIRHNESYKRIDNDSVSYKYVDSYSEYLDFTNNATRMNELKEEDFDGEKSYLIYITDIDVPTSKMKYIKTEIEDNTFKIYFETVTNHSTSQKAFAFEVVNNSLYAEGYYKVTGQR